MATRVRMCSECGFPIIGAAFIFQQRKLCQECGGYLESSAELAEEDKKRKNWRGRQQKGEV